MDVVTRLAGILADIPGVLPQPHNTNLGGVGVVLWNSGFQDSPLSIGAPGGPVPVTTSPDDPDVAVSASRPLNCGTTAEEWPGLAKAVRAALKAGDGQDERVVDVRVRGGRWVISRSFS